MTVTGIVSALCVSIWLHYSRSFTCCVRIRTDIDLGTGLCPPAATDAPCRGFTGSCAELSFSLYGFGKGVLDYRLEYLNTSAAAPAGH